MRVQSIVEGHGEVSALPVLLRRLLCDVGPVQILPPIRVPRGRLAQQSEVSRAVEFAAKFVEPGDGILLVLDADGDCPARLGPQLRGWTRAARPDRRIAVVVANNEYEAWFVAAARSLAIAGKLPPGTEAHPDPETVRDPKGWLRDRMGRRYSEPLDQAAFSALMDLDAARGCPCFDKLVREVRGWFDASTEC